MLAVEGTKVEAMTRFLCRALCGALALAVLLGALPATAKTWEEDEFWHRPVRYYSFEPPNPARHTLGQTVVGQDQSFNPEKGDTFFDVARFYGLGLNELADANPGRDEWIPSYQGKPLAIPTRFVLPCCTYSGIVINIPEMRLYYYPPNRGGPRTVVTYAVGLGREEWKTPVGKFVVREKTVNPTWVIPESIRKERIADNGFSEKMIPGGSPDNPLGKYRMRLSLNLYGIHGTNIPWGVGMLVSHGCVRLYPEDIEKLYPTVPQGTSGEFVYQTVKAGVLGDDVYVEVHKDLYGSHPGPWREAMAVLERQGLLSRVDQNLLRQAVLEQSGMAVNVSRASRPGGGLDSEDLRVEPAGRETLRPRPDNPPAEPEELREDTTPGDGDEAGHDEPEKTDSVQPTGAGQGSDHADLSPAHGADRSGR
jgi:L,D-transpeptidase ErfK/SrfK